VRRASFFARGTWLGRRGLNDGAHLDGRLAQQTGNDFTLLVVFHEHVFLALGIGTLNGEDHVIES
jgi:hypothetical protein